ncbi:MAG: hypothetical protein FWG68_00795, partial [Defluviitaleaceae bacterium]|nr:hypothetical protein [Defluviitaleaceae bacterium]
TAKPWGAAPHPARSAPLDPLNFYAKLSPVFSLSAFFQLNEYKWQFMLERATEKRATKRENGKTDDRPRSPVFF